MICILLRDFATTQEKRLNPNLPDAPLVLIEAGKYRPKVIAPDAEARQAGVKAGMWLGEARSLCPQAEFLPVDENRYRRIFMDITGTLLDVTDRIEPEYQATSAAWYCDDKLILPYLLNAIEETTGINPQVGHANSKFPARVASAITGQLHPCEIKHGDEKAFLSPYPVTLLPLDKSMQRRLPLLGIKTLGQLADLPRIAIWEQFGKHGRWLHDLANAKDIRPLSPFIAPIILSDTSSFDDPISDRVVLHRVLEKFSLNLIDKLQGRESYQLNLIVTLCKDEIIEHHRQVSNAVRDHLYLLRLLTQILDGLLIEVSVEQLEVRLSDIREHLPVQLSLFETRKPVVSLQEIAPEWASRYRQADFYHLLMNDMAFLLEETVERQVVTGA